MQRHKQDLQAAEQTNATEEKLLSALEQIEILREVVKTLNLESRYQKQQLQELGQELIYTNQELCTALQLENINLAQVKALARQYGSVN